MHDLYQIGSVKVFKWYLQKNFNIFVKHCGKILQIAILPVKPPFPETTWFMFCPNFCTPSSCHAAPIASIVDLYRSSWKVRFETSKFHLHNFNISNPFFAAKTGIYPSKQIDMIHVLSSVDFRFLNVFGRKICHNSLLRIGILFPSPEVMHTPRSHPPLHFDKGNIQQVVTGK